MGAPRRPAGARRGPRRVAAARTLAETTCLTPRYLEQLYAFGNLDRSPGDRVVSIVYWALVRSEEADVRRRDENVRWFAADALPDLAFDHNLIVEYALWRLRNKLEYSRIAHAFLGDTFTLAELREVHEAVLQKPLDPANFRRQIEASGRSFPPNTCRPAAGTARPASTATTARSTAGTTAPLGNRSVTPGTAARSIMTITPPSTAPSTQISAGTRAGRDLQPRARAEPVGLRRADARLRPRRVDGRRHPGRLAAPGRSCPRTTATRRRRGARRAASAPPRQTLGDRVVILGHFYQRDEVVQYADFVGDSFQLANAAQRTHRRRGDRLLRRALHGRDRRHPRHARSRR